MANGNNNQGGNGNNNSKQPTFQELEAIEKSAELLAKTTQLAEDKLKYEKASLDLLKKELDVLIKSGKYKKEDIELRRQLIAEQEAIIENLKEHLRLQEEINKAGDRAAEAFRSQLQSLTGISDNWKTTTSGALAYAVSVGKGEEALEGMKDAVVDMAKNAFPSLMQQVMASSKQMLTSQIDARAAFVRATGANADQITSLQQSSTEFLAYGVTASDVANIAANLTNKLNNFNDMTEVQKKKLVETTGLLDQLGVSVETSTTAYADLNRMLGTTPEQFEELALKLKTVSGNGISTEKVFQDLSSTMPQLAAHGENLADEFVNLASQAKLVGVETSQLISIASQFDQFESGAKSVGQLNALLGGDYLNSIDLMAMSESERIETLMEGVAASGKSWAAMSRHERMALANAAGISNMADAAKIFGKSLSEYREEQKKLASEEESIEKMKELSVQAQTVSESLTNLATTFVASFAPIVPYIDYIRIKIAEADAAVRSWSDGAVGLGSVIGVPLIVIAGAFTAIMLAVQAMKMTLLIKDFFAWASAIWAGAGASGADATAKGAQSTATVTLGRVSAVSAKQMMAMAGVIVAIGASIAIVLIAMKELIEVISKDSVSGFEILAAVLISAAVAFGIFKFSMATIAGVAAASAPAIAAAAVPILAIGVSIGLVVGSVALAAAAFSMLVDSIKGLDMNSALAFGIVAMAMVGLGAGASLVQAAAVALGVFTIAFAAFGYVLSSIDLTKSVYPLAELMREINTATKESVDNFEKLATSVDKIFSSSSELALSGGSVNLSLLKEIIVGGNNSTAKAASSSNASFSGGGSGEIIVKVYLDDREVKTFVKNTIIEEVNKRTN